MTPNPFCKLPNEVLLSILCWQSPDDIISLSHVPSRQLRQSALDDVIWLPICFSFISKIPCNSPEPISLNYFRSNTQKFAQAGRAPQESHASFYYFYLRYIHRCDWLYGAFLPSSEKFPWIYVVSMNLLFCFLPSSDICPVRVEGGAMAARGRVLQPSHLTDTQMRLLVNDFLDLDTYNGVDLLRLPTEGGSSFDIENMVSMELRSVDSEYDVPSPFILSSGPKVQYASGLKLDYLPHITHWSQGVIAERWDLAKRKVRHTFDNAPFPSVYMIPALKDTDEYTLGQSLVTSAIQISARDFSSSIFLPLRSFNAAPNDQIIQPGYYAAPYSVHGIEILFVHIRALTDADFQVSWPWEGSMNERTEVDGEVDWPDPSKNLGPFSSAYGQGGELPSRIVLSNVRPGSRILEVVKLTGDANVPRGQRSIVAFLDDPSVDPQKLREAEFLLPLTPPSYSSEEVPPPWPVLDIPSNLNEPWPLETKLSPRTGLDIPGRARMAGTRFKRPQWTECVVHIDSRTSLSVWWEAFDSASNFVRIDGL